jgi:hypothetical protein
MFQGQKPPDAMRLPEVPTNSQNKSNNSPIYDTTGFFANAKAISGTIRLPKL